MKQFVVLIVLAFVSNGLGFKCSKVGLYADKRAPDCDGYFVCGSNGTFAQRSRCPGGTRFSQRQLRCVPADTIVCNLRDVASNLDCQTEGAQGVPELSGECWDTIVCRETRNGSLVGFAGLCNNCSCIVPDVGEDDQDLFMCPDVGRYPDPESENCLSYNLCVKGVDDRLVRSKMTCSRGTVFSPKQKKCVLETNYKCPNELTSSTTEAAPEETTTQDDPEEAFKCFEAGRYPDGESLDCRGYVICSKTADGAFVQSKATCPTRTVFNPNTSRCVLADSYSCPSAVSTTATSSTVPTPPFNVCSETGRFPDMTSNDCRKYLICSENVNGTVVQSSDTCPPRTVFNPESRRCVLATAYSCPTAPSTGAPSITEPNALFICAESGRFDDVESSDCKKYIMCSKNAEGELFSSSVTCPRGTIFNADTKRCVLENSYACPRLTATTTTTTPTTTATTTTTASITYQLFSCPDVGRYVDPDSMGCRTYILCTRNSEGELLPNVRHCPTNNVFDETTKRCVSKISYSCPRG